MKILAVELRRVTLPLVEPFRSSLGVEHARDVLLVKVAGAEAEGWGECSALPSPLYTSEYVESAHHVLRHHLVPRLLDRREVPADAVAPTLAAVKGHPMAKAALEMAVLDAELRAAGRSFGQHLGAVRGMVDAGAAVGIAASLPELVDAVDRCVSQGYRRVKLKVEPGWDVEPVRAVRERFGDELMLLVDANGAYTLADTAHLAHLDAFGLAMVEQPLPADDLSGHAELARRIRTPVCLDESITSPAVAAHAVAVGAAAVVNVKAGRLGGYLAARRVHDVCRDAGVPVWCGGMFETGLGRAANLALAALPNFTFPGDLSASDRYYAEDITPPVVLEHGRLRVPTAPGVGVDVRHDVLHEHTTSAEVLQP